MSGIKLNIEADVMDMLKHLDFSKVEVVDKAIVRSINDVATKAKKAAQKSIAKEAGIKQKAFKKHIVTIKARADYLTAYVSVRKLRFNLIEYKGTRQTKRGVTSSSWGKRKLYKSTFMATMKNGKRLVMVRKSKKRLPIRGVWGASITQTFADQITSREMDRVVRSNFRKRFKHHVDFLSKKT